MTLGPRAAGLRGHPRFVRDTRTAGGHGHEEVLRTPGIGGKNVSKLTFWV